jgi:hypothetical protein
MSRPSAEYTRPDQKTVVDRVAEENVASKRVYTAGTRITSSHCNFPGPGTVVGCHTTSWYVAVSVKLDSDRTNGAVTAKICSAKCLLLKEKKPRD